MVEARYQGKPVSSLPEEAFAEGLSRSGLSPVLLLASPTTVPVTTDERWWLAKENVSGHYGRIFYAAVRELVIRSDIISVVRSIADENFTSEHMGYFERLTSDEKEVVFSDYLRTLAEGGLTCTEKNLVKLTQDLWHCCKVSDEAAFCLIQRPYISKTLLTRRISPRGSP
uniref:Uncharacterized protein n=1 Tax=Enterobacter hormaechei subsp. xiangfangensis TaxID=1296536 RepID=A0A7I8HRK3_9ENTR|nr:hypothetical protein [Enterobacter hormaechei]BCM29738.1 hypothetical protein [Enterobacter hormaechei subsp. xiangfangensis]